MREARPKSCKIASTPQSCLPLSHTVSSLGLFIVLVAYLFASPSWSLLGIDPCLSLVGTTPGWLTKYKRASRLVSQISLASQSIHHHYHSIPLNVLRLMGVHWWMMGAKEVSEMWWVACDGFLWLIHDSIVLRLHYSWFASVVNTYERACMDVMAATNPKWDSFWERISITTLFDTFYNSRNIETAT